MHAASAHATGSRMESAAARFLCGLGWTVIERNWRAPCGELDIVARDGDTLVFVEVRARRSNATYAPEETIGQRKIERLLATAAAYLDACEWAGMCRFDVVAVSMTASGYEMRLISDAIRR